MNVSSVKNLNGGVLSAVQDASLTNVVQTNSGNWQDITAYQNASATYLTEVSIPESATWNEVSTTVQTNSAQWAEGGNTEVGSYVVTNSASIDETVGYVQTNSATINDVNTSYQTNSGTFLTQQEVSHDNTLSGNGTAESPLGIVNGYNETVLWSGNWQPGDGKVATNSAIEVSESIDNFEYIRVVIEGVLCQVITVTPYECQAFICYPEKDSNNNIVGLKFTKDDSTHIRFRCGYSTNIVSSYRSNQDWGYFTLKKIIGINRK